MSHSIDHYNSGRKVSEALFFLNSNSEGNLPESIARHISGLIDSHAGLYRSFNREERKKYEKGLKDWVDDHLVAQTELIERQRALADKDLTFFSEGNTGRHDKEVGMLNKRKSVLVDELRKLKLQVKLHLEHTVVEHLKKIKSE